MSRVYKDPYATVPEWLLYRDEPSRVSDRAVRLFLVLDRHADAAGRAFPGRPKLAERLNCGVSSLDRAMAELAEAGAVVVQPEYRADGSRTSNSYWLWPAHPPVGRGTTTGEATPYPPVKPCSPTRGEAYKEGNESQLTKASERKPETPGGATSEAAPPSDFDRFWDTYPLKKSKPAAMKAWRLAVKKEPVESIIAAAERYRRDPNRHPSYTKHPSTWLNNECWDDGPEPPRTNGKAKFVPDANIDTDRTGPSGERVYW